MSMDRAITPKRSWPKRIVGGLAGLVFIGYTFTQLLGSNTQETSLSIDLDSLQLATVQQADFAHYIPTRGTIAPKVSVVLSTLVNGQVKTIFNEAGTQLKQGDAILQLSNPQLEFDVLTIEGELFQQSNQLLATELQLNNSIAASEKELERIRYDISQISAELSRNRRLAQQQLVQASTIEDLERDLGYQQQLEVITLATIQRDRNTRDEQLAELKQAERHLRQRLSITQTLLNQLTVTAPIEGELIQLDAKPGSLKASGSELGTIADTKNLHIQAYVDEFYSRQLHAGGKASLSLPSGEEPLHIQRIYPQVEDGKIKLELSFVNSLKQDLKPNQSFPLRIHTTEAKPSLLISNGPFMSDTHGAWVYVVDKVRKTARKQPIRIGKQTPQQLEVISGLSEHDQVIISSYASFGEADRLDIKL